MVFKKFLLPVTHSVYFDPQVMEIERIQSSASNIENIGLAFGGFYWIFCIKIRLKMGPKGIFYIRLLGFNMYEPGVVIKF